MAEDKIPVEIEVSSTFEGKGTDGAVSALAALQKRITGISSAVGAIGALMRGFGIVAIISSIVGQISALVKRINDAKTAAAELNGKIAAINRAAALQTAQEEYKKLELAIAGVNARLEEQNALEEMKGQSGRAKEDAASRLAEVRELMALHPDDPLKAGKEGDIRAKYASGRAQAEAARKEEDNARDIRRLQQQREGLAASSSADNRAADEMASDARGRRRAATEAKLKGEKPKAPSIVEPMLSLSPIYALAKLAIDAQNPAGAAAAKTPAPDPAAQEAAAKKAAQLNKEAAELEIKAAEKTRQSYALLDQIEIQSADRGTLAVEGQAAKAEGSLARRTAAAGTESARRGVLAEHRRRQEEELGVWDREDAADYSDDAADSSAEYLEDLRTRADKEGREASAAHSRMADVPKNQRKGSQWDRMTADTRREDQESSEANAAYAEALVSLKAIIKEFRDTAEKFRAEVRQIRDRQASSRDSGNTYSDTYLSTPPTPGSISYTIEPDLYADQIEVFKQMNDTAGLTDVEYTLSLAHHYTDYEVTLYSSAVEATLTLLGVPVDTIDFLTGPFDTAKHDFGTGFSMDGKTKILDTKETINGIATLQAVGPFADWTPINGAYAFPSPPSPLTSFNYFRLDTWLYINPSFPSPANKNIIIDYHFDP